MKPEQPIDITGSELGSDTVLQKISQCSENMNETSSRFESFMRNGKNLLIIFSIVAINFRLAASSDARKRLDKSCENGICFREQDKGPCILSDDEPRLFRWDPIKVRCC